ncbi:unnamed protein product, partial [Vitis vinifera]|uniref:Uncharacterized protein n=1 Tax=Vitis vinifera TaxID=29760 RepID=E0CTV4_VITVI
MSKKKTPKARPKLPRTLPFRATRPSWRPPRLRKRVRGVYRKEWCQCRSEALMDHGAKERHIHRPIRGPGESMGRSPSRALLIQGGIIDAAVQRAAQPENK